MPDLFYGMGAYSRARGNLPELPVVNMFVEASPASEKGVVLQSRAGLIEEAQVGTGPVHALFQKNGVFNGARFALSGSKLYRDTIELGSIAGNDVASLAASPSRLLVTRGSSLHGYDGLSLTVQAMPDGDEAVAVGYLAGYEIVIHKGTNKFSFRRYTADSFDGLDYANAENEPDELLDLLIMDDQIVFLGAETVEFWPKTGDAAAPFAPIAGRVFERGVKATGAACRFDNSFAWVGNNGCVYIAENVPRRISDNGIEERIAASSSFTLWTYFHEGVEMLVLRLSQGTWVFSAASKQWSEFQGYGRSNWRAGCAIDGPIFGDDETGKLWRFENGFTDAGGPLERRFRAAVPMSGGVMQIANVRLTANVGEATDLIGTYADPVVEIRTSRDAGRTWGAWRQTKLGAQGKYRTLVEWRALGMFDAPGMIAEFRVTDPVPFRISAVKANEPTGGRSR